MLKNLVFQAMGLPDLHAFCGANSLARGATRPERLRKNNMQLGRRFDIWYDDLYGSAWKRRVVIIDYDAYKCDIGMAGIRFSA